MYHTPLDMIRRNPWQPRRREDPGLAASLLEYYDRLPHARCGLLQIPLARAVTPDGVPVESDRSFGSSATLAVMIDKGEALAELAFGHRRYAAFSYLAAGGGGRPPDERFFHMPLDLISLSDHQMALYAFRENQDRDDLTWVEQARFINQFINRFEITQEEAAQQLGMGTQGTVANYLRAMRAIEEFGDDTLAQLVEEGRFPLLHTLHLIPLMRDYTDVAREYLAAGNLFDSEDNVRTATAIKADVDRLLKGLRGDEDDEVEEAEGDIALNEVDVQDAPKPGLPLRTGSEYHEPGLDDGEEIEEAPCLAEAENDEPQAAETGEADFGEEDVEDWLSHVAAGERSQAQDATRQHLRKFAHSLRSIGQCLEEAQAAATTDADAAILAHLGRLFNTATGSLSKMADGLLEGGLDDVRERLEKLPPALHGQQLPRMMTELLRAQTAPASKEPGDARERAA